MHVERERPLAKLSLPSFDLLLRLLEAPRLVFDHALLVGHWGPVGEELISAGVMEPAGYGLMVLPEDDDRDRVHVVQHSTHHGALGFHDEARSFVGVRKEALRRYKPALGVIVASLLGAHLRMSARGLVEIETDAVWDLGVVALGRAKSTNVWFARRLSDPRMLAKLRSAIERRPSSDMRLVLTSTSNDSLPSASPRLTKIVPVGDVLSSLNPMVVDIDMLGARFAGRPASDISGPLHLSDDGRTLTINGNTVIDLRGGIQIAMVRALVDAFAKGRKLKAADILEDAGSQSNSLDQAFGGKWNELRPHLKVKDGLWSFEI